MCVEIRFNDGKDVSSVDDFEEKFNVNADDFKYPDDESELIRSACLCQIDLDSFMSDKLDKFYEDCGDWYER